MVKPRRGFADTEIGQIHYRIAVPENPIRPPLVCLHQSPKSSREFDAFIRKASRDRIVVGLDSPGHGESDLPPENPPVRVQDYARILWQALDSLNLGVVDVFGNHTGAKVAVEMAYQRPDSIRKIIMLSALVLSPEEQKAFENQFQPIPLDEAGTRFTHMWKQILHYQTEGSTLEIMAKSFGENLRAGEAYEWGHAAAFAYNAYFPDVVATLPHEITVLNPKDMLYEYTPRVAPLLQNGEVVDLPQWGNDALNIFTDDVVQTVKGILDR